MQLTIKPEDDGKSLINFLKGQKISFSLVQKFLRQGSIFVDEKKTTSNIKIYTNQTVTLPDYTLRENSKHGKLTGDSKYIDLNKYIIYQDENIIAINKPSGLAVQGGSGISICVDDYAKHHNYKLVHRLDKDTSGILILAKSIDSARRLTDAFKTKLVEKTYVAIVEGIPDDTKGTINIGLVKKIFSGVEKIVADKDGAIAITNYKIIKNLPNNLFLLELSPLTGRKHQLRVHCSYIGSPIVGDTKYGKKDSAYKGKKLFLHACKIELSSKIFGKKIYIKAEIPEHFHKIK